MSFVSAGPFESRPTGRRGGRRVAGERVSFAVLATYLVFVFLTGGGARADISSLVVLRPVAAAACGYALWRLSAAQTRSYASLLSLASACLILTLLHLVPLPASVWTALPGRDLVRTIDEAAGLAGASRPLSLVPLDTMNAAYSLLVPFAALLLAIGLPPQQQRRLLPVLLAIGGVAVTMGALQAISPQGAGLYLYRVTNSAAAVGLFANRNHQALFLAMMFPMLAVFASGGDARSGPSGRRRYLACAAGVVLLPLLLITGSRAGILLGAMGIAAVPLLYDAPRRAAGRTGRARLDLRIAVAGGALLVVVTVAAARAEGFERLFGSSVGEESRLLLWRPIMRAIADFFPFGSGIGSFAPVYQVYEPQSLLTPEYLNHAHNDYLELALTGGLAALLLAAAAALAWGRSAMNWLRRGKKSEEARFGRLGALLILMVAIASLVDYPARVPSIACVLALAAVWARGADPGRQAAADVMEPRRAI